MPTPNRMLRRCLRPQRIVVAAAVMLALLSAGAPAAAQPAPPPPPPGDRPPPPPRDNPGLVNEIQKLLSSPSKLLPSFGRDDAGERSLRPPGEQPLPPPPAPVAGPAPSPLPPSPSPAPSSPMVPSVVTGHQVCPVVPGSGPNCQAAADILCRSKGYTLGKSLGVDSTEKCSAKVLIPGRPREPGDCRTENFVTRAWCQ
ncbi:MULTISPECIES: hypothetical protein [Rhodopseudomonas]|nr:MULTISPECIES: hypothetical protein [Rhodopseudomonas]